MKPYLFGIDNKPCIWPVPSECTWNNESYKLTGPLKIAGPGQFSSEINMFMESLKNICDYESEFVESKADITITKYSSVAENPEEYSLNITDNGIELKSGTNRGIFNGLQTLIQLIEHSPDSYIHGAYIADKPLKAFRGVHVYYPEHKNLNWFKGFIGFLAKYKFNQLIFEINSDLIFEDWAYELSRYLKDRLFDIILKIIPSRNFDYKSLEGALSIFKPSAVSVSFDRITNVTSDELADYINNFRDWLHTHSTRLIVNSYRLYEATGSARLIHNKSTLQNEIIPSTYEAVNNISKDIIIDNISHGGFKNDTCSEDYFGRIGFTQIFGNCSGPLVNWEERIRRDNILGAYVGTSTEASDSGIGMMENKLYEIIKVSCILWWEGFKGDHTSTAYVLPEYLEQTVCKLYPYERDLLNCTINPSLQSDNFKTLNLRELYNATLSRIKFREDDYNFSFLEEAKSICTILPFSLLQGVRNFNEDPAFIISGNMLNDGIQGIQVRSKAKSLVFLHTYLVNKTSRKKGGKSEQDSEYLGYFIDSDSGSSKEDYALDTVAYYVIYYKDGTKERVGIRFGKDICFWNGNSNGNFRGHGTTPVFSGVTNYKAPYIICFQEWINPKTDTEIIKIDIEHTTDCKEEGIALFAITAVQ